MMQRVRGASQDRHDRLMRTMLVEDAQFATNDMHIVRGLDSKGHSAARHSADHHGDPFADHNLLANSSSKNQHRAPPSSIAFKSGISFPTATPAPLVSNSSAVYVFVETPIQLRDVIPVFYGTYDRKS
jgi:hypothetical protein